MDKLKKIFWYKIEDRSIVQPWYLGLAYYDIVKWDTYLCVMPLNLIIRGVVRLYTWIKFGK